MKRSLKRVLVFIALVCCLPFAAAGEIAGQDFVAGQVIVGYKEGANISSAIAAIYKGGGQIVKRIGGPGSAMLIDYGSEAKALAAISQLQRQPGVAYVERNGIVRLAPPELKRPQKQGGPGPGGEKSGSILQGAKPLAVSNDPGTGFQYHQTVIRKTAALPALSATPPTVAVLDTGVDWTHPDLVGKVIAGRNTVGNNMLPFDDNGHGTHVAGIIAASADNNAYGEGVCPKCKILAVKVLTSEGWGTWFDIATGMDYARTVTTSPPTRVVNMSLGGGYSSLIASQVLALKNAGKVLVAAAGNDNTTSPTYAQPGADPNTALRVMATEQNDCRAWFSNFSPSSATNQYNIAAPGWMIPSTVPDLGYAYYSGTSMASPVVAGAAALVWGQLPTLTRDGLVNRLVNNAKTISCGFAVNTKRVDVRKAITGTAETAIIGRLLDPFTAKAPIVNTAPATAQLLAGTTLLRSDLTNRGGSYEMTGLGAGTGRTLKGLKAGYNTGLLRGGVAITGGLVNGPFTDALAISRPTGNATITVDWKATQPIESTTGCTGACNSWELDLYVKLPSGAYVYWYNSGDLLAPPYVVHARDSAVDLEPLETSVIGSQAANGVYRIFIGRYTSSYYWNPSWTGSLASLQMYNGANAFGSLYNSPPASCGTSTYWYVGDLTKNGNNYTWTNRNTCSNTAP